MKTAALMRNSILIITILLIGATKVCTHNQSDNDPSNKEQTILQKNFNKLDTFSTNIEAAIAQIDQPKSDALQEKIKEKFVRTLGVRRILRNHPWMIVFVNRNCVTNLYNWLFGSQTGSQNNTAAIRNQARQQIEENKRQLNQIINNQTTAPQSHPETPWGQRLDIIIKLATNRTLTQLIQSSLLIILEISNNELTAADQSTLDAASKFLCAQIKHQFNHNIEMHLNQQQKIELLTLINNICLFLRSTDYKLYILPERIEFAKIIFNALPLLNTDTKNKIIKILNAF